MGVININQKFESITGFWKPGIIAALNGQEVKIAKVKGEFVWHDHKEEDELFYVLKGRLTILLPEESVTINEGEMYIVPKGVEHKPVAKEETWLLLFEPSETKHTGDVQSHLTVNQKKRI